MLLRKIDGEKNVQNCVFSTKLINEDDGDMLHDQQQFSLTRTVIFWWYNTFMFMLARSQLTLRRWLRGWRRRLTAASWLTAVAPRMMKMALRLPEIAQTAHCRHQTHRQQWPSNPNSWSKFRNLFVYVSKMATNAPAAAPRLTEIIQTTRCRCRKHRRRWRGDDQDRSKFHNYETLCLRDQTKHLKKHLFAVRSQLLRWHWALCISCYHSQRLLFSPMKNNFSTTLSPTEKPRDTYCIFFCRFYL